MLRSFGPERTAANGEENYYQSFFCSSVLIRWFLFIGYCSVVLVLFTNNTTIMNSSGVFIQMSKDKDKLIPSSTTGPAKIEPPFAKSSDFLHLRRTADCQSPPISLPNFLKNADAHDSWDQCDVYYPDSFTCQWAFYKNTPVCLNPDDTSLTYLNHVVTETGHWPECEKLVASYLQQATTTSEAMLYVELGNPSVCTVDMLLSTNANVVVMDNNEEKLHALTATILHLPKELRQRVIVFPNVELPTEPMLTYDKNQKKKNFFFGSSSSNTEQSSEETSSVPLSALSSIFKNTNIALLKIDAPGLSCNIIEEWNRCTVTYEPPPPDAIQLEQS
mmetsp:Transcript_12459/g.19202  ORF Transcript_12459/g.19202 Transcript_12459/m.19202 type:complete len:332 (-) Transcript_12459:3070-4065(-)